MINNPKLIERITKELKDINENELDEVIRNVDVEEAKKSLEKFAYSIYGAFSAEEAKRILQYIEQLETKQQNMMKFLTELKKEYIEELKYKSTRQEAIIQLELIDKILELPF